MFLEFDGQSAESVIDRLGLVELPVEGGYWKTGPRNPMLNSILYLMTPTAFSAMHRLTVAEGWQWLAGDPCHMLQLKPDGTSLDLELGRAWPQTIVEPGTWQGCSTDGQWTLVSCWCAPAFTDDCFTLGQRAQLIREYPKVSARIGDLTR